MKIRSLLNTYQKSLKDIYQQQEISAIFFNLTEHFYQIKRIDLSLHPDMTVPDDKLLSYLEALQHHKPWQYITGQTEFYGLPFKVNKHTLIPRPETEELVQWIINAHQNNSNLKILDIGTGSGAIAISLAKKMDKAQISAIDFSKHALEVARENARLNKVKIDFKHLDILKLKKSEDYFDIIVSNPPYVRNSEKKMMSENVLNYEPATALFVTDNNPLIFYRQVIEIALNSQTKSLYFEINEALKTELTDLFKTYKLTNFEFKKDIFDKWRFVKLKVEG